MKKNLLIIGPLPKPVTGISLANEMFIEGCKQRGYVIDVIDTNTENELNDYKSQGKFNWNKIWVSLVSIMKGMKKLITHQYEVVYITPAQSYMGFMKYLPFIQLAHLKKMPVYLHFHGGYIREMYEKLSKNKKGLIRAFFNKSEGLIVLGESLKYMLEDLVPQEKIKVCENGVEMPFILSPREAREKLHLVKQNSKVEILYLSNLMETKGILDLLEACCHLEEQGMDFHVSLAGNIEPCIKERVNTYLKQLGQRATYCGIVSGEAKRQLLQQAQIFCLPTYYPTEGQPISILEAMGMGCAIVTTYQGGIKDIVKDRENGEICEAKNALSICEAIKASRMQYDLYLTNNTEQVRAYYSETQFVERLLKIMNR